MASYEADFSQWIESAVFNGVVGSEKMNFVSLEDIGGAFTSVFGNSPVSSTLATAASAGASSVDLVDATAFPVVSNPASRAVEIIIDENDPSKAERVNYSSKTGNTLQLFAGSTLAKSHSVGAPVRVINRYLRVGPLSSPGGALVKYDDKGTIYSDLEVHFTASNLDNVLLAGVVARYSEISGTTQGYAFLAGDLLTGYGGYIYKISGSGVLSILGSGGFVSGSAPPRRYKAILNGSSLGLFRYNPSTNSWEQIAGAIDTSYASGVVGAMVWQSDSNKIFAANLDNIEIYV